MIRGSIVSPTRWQQTLICLRWLEKNIIPNGGVMVLNPMVESKKITFKQTKGIWVFPKIGVPPNHPF